MLNDYEYFDDETERPDVDDELFTFNEWLTEDIDSICPHCNGTTLSPYDDGGSCPHCFNGWVL